MKTRERAVREVKALAKPATAGKLRSSSHEVQGISYMIFAAFIGSIVSASVKHLLVTMSPLLIFWFSRLFPLLGLIPILIKNRSTTLKTRRIFSHLILNLFYVSSVGCFFYSMAFIPLVDATLLFNSAPLYSPLLSMVLIKEAFPAKFWIFIFISFVGVLLVLQPGSSLFQSASLIGALSGVLLAVAQVCNRRLTRYESPNKIVFYMILFAPILSSLTWCFFPHLMTPIPFKQIATLSILGQLAITGVATWLYQLYRSKAVLHTRVGIVMPFSYTAVIFSGVIDWAFWGNVPNMLSLFGIVVVCAGSYALLRACKTS